MDELVQHCLRELAFDGELGSNVSRLRDFTEEFYATHTSQTRQNADDAYHSLLWSILIQQPSVRVGTVPDGTTAEVFFPPQPRAVKIAKAASVDLVTTKGEASMTMQLEPVPDAKSAGLGELVLRYGGKLRISVDPETSFAAITGSHARPAKLSPMVYAVLQLVSRARDAGVSVLEIGKASGYDQKACFYIVKQLLELGLVVKLRRGGNSQNFCVHKYFYDNSPLWQKLRDEEAHAHNESHDDDYSPKRDGDGESEPILHFEPIDVRGLSSLSLLRSRIVRLLKSSPYQTHVYHNIALAIGFHPANRSERRFFITRMRELLAEGVIEKVLVPSARSNKVLCVRLVSAEARLGATSDGVVVQPEDTGDDNEVETMDIDGGIIGHLRANKTLQAQIVDYLQDTGTTGATLLDLSRNLNAFDRRTLELQLTRMVRSAPPAHLADLTTVEFMETYGRERRHRYFTLPNYRQLLEREGISDTDDIKSGADLTSAGQFMNISGSDFYTTVEECRLFEDSLGGSAGQEPKPSRRTYKNPILPDGTRKRGRPRKDSTDVGTAKSMTDMPVAKKHGRPLKTVGVDDPNANDGTAQSKADTPVKRKRGRPRKDATTGAGNANNEDTMNKTNTLVVTKRAGKRKRGVDEHSEGEAEGDGRRDNQVTGETQPSGSAATAEVAVDLTVGAVMRGRAQPCPAPKCKQKISRKRLRTAPTGSDMATMTVNSVSIQTDLTATAIGSNASDQPGLQRNASPPHDAGQQAQSLGSGGVSVVSSTESGRPAKRRRTRGKKASMDSANIAKASSTGSQKEMVFPKRKGRQMREIASHVAETTSHEETAIGEPHNMTDVSPSVSHGVDISSVQDPSDDNLLQRSAENRLLARETQQATPSGSTAPLDNIDPCLLPAPQPEKEVVPQSSAAVTPASKPLDESFSSKPSSLTTVPEASASRRKSNISWARRENEILRLAEESGGILNTSSKEFVDAHMNLLERMIRAGEATSAPAGTRLDRRTLNTVMQNLESRGRIKVLTASLPVVPGGHPAVKIAYLPSVSQDQIDAFLPTISAATRPTNAGVSYLDLPLQPVRASSVRPKEREDSQVGSEPEDVPTALPDGRNLPLAQRLFTYSDNAIREALLQERLTQAQLYGFIVGRNPRVKALHLHTVQQLLKDLVPSNTASVERRVIGTSYFYNMPLSTYCSLIPISFHSDALLRALSSKEYRHQRINSLPSSLQRLISPHKVQNHRRLDDLLLDLAALRLMVPLQRSDLDKPWILYTPKGDHPTGFDLHEDTSSAPDYWLVSESAPVYLVALSRKQPPFLKDMPVSTMSEAQLYWEELQKASTDKQYAEAMALTANASNGSECPFDAKILTRLSRDDYWRASYQFTWYQTQYLKRFIDAATTHTPLDDPDGGEALLQRLGRVTSAPAEAIRQYYETNKAWYLRQRKRKMSKAKRRDLEEQVRRRKEAKGLLSQKAAEAKRQRGHEWDELVKTIVTRPPNPNVTERLRRLRESYIRGNSIKSMSRWKEDITRAVEASEKTIGAHKLFPSPNRDIVLRPAKPMPATAPAATRKSVQEIIQLQSRRMKNSDAQASRKGKGKAKVQDPNAADEELKPKRHRFAWNTDFDELACDAAAIIRARCRSNFRIDWGALEQVFPHTPRNSVRQRIGHIMAAPGMDAYLRKLEEAWHNFWIQHRGNDELPDPDWMSLTKFDLIKHIEVLRRYIDKNAIRVGFPDDNEQRTTKLLPNIAEMLTEWDVVEVARNNSALKWDFVWTTQADETRERMLLESPFIRESESLTFDCLNDNICVAESTLKIVLGTPNESYDAELAASLLHRLGEQRVNMAVQNLKTRNLLAKLVRDPKRRIPGRTLKISEVNQSMLGGPIPRDTFVDACQFEDSFNQAEEWYEWPQVVSDGDMAALVELVSQHQVEFQVDTALARGHRDDLDWNSKKAADDDIEVAVHLRPLSTRKHESRQISFRGGSIDEDDVTRSGVAAHGLTSRGGPACCSQTSDGVIDCQACLDLVRVLQSEELHDVDHTLATRIMGIVDAHSPGGASRDLLRKEIQSICTEETCLAILQRLSALPIPMVHFVGYEIPLVVSAYTIDPWTIYTPEREPLRKFFPRRWLDIHGDSVPESWDAARRAVEGAVLGKPGISQAELRWRHRAVYDRQELNELLARLEKSGNLERRSDRRSSAVLRNIAGVEEGKEETQIFWFVTERKRWYELG